MLCLFCPAVQFVEEPLGGSALASHSDKLKCKLLTQFSAFFSRFMASCVHTGTRQQARPSSTSGEPSASVGEVKQKVSESVGRCFVSGCHLLCLLAQIPLSLSFSAESRGE